MSREKFLVYIKLGYAGREPAFKTRTELSPVQILKLDAIEEETKKVGEKFKTNSGRNLSLKVSRRKKKPKVKSFKGELPF